MSLKLTKYLQLVRRKAAEFESIDINGKQDEGKFGKYVLKAAFGCISLLLFFFLQTGFSPAFVAYCASSLAILVGLFITALVFGFDKFYQQTSEKEYADAKSKLWDTQAYNYVKQFGYITGYTIVQSIFALLLLSLSALFEKQSQINVFELRYFNSWSVEVFSPLLLLGVACLFSAQRVVVIYLLLRITYQTLFIVASMVQFMTTKISRN